MVMDHKLVKKLTPYVLIIFLQFATAGFAILAKTALNQGSSHFTLAVYRNAFAAAVFLPFAFVLERRNRPRVTPIIFIRILILSSLDPVIGQNLFYSGMKYSTATIASALCNLLPSFTFLMAWILRMEKVRMKEIGSVVKIVGTLITFGGAMIMTIWNGPTLGLPWTHKSNDSSTNPNDRQDPIKGATMIGASSIIYSAFYILQLPKSGLRILEAKSSILKSSYPASLSLTAIVCTLGAFIGTLLTFTAERGNTAVWALGWDAKLFAYVYGGVFSSGICYYVSGVVMKDKGPVFVTAFNPLSMVITALLSSFILAEQMTLGKVSGGVVIVIGLYFVMWGKGKDKKEAQVVQQQHTPENDIHHSIKPAKEDDSDKISGHNVV